MRVVLGLLALGWLAERPWAQVLVAGVILIGLAIIVWGTIQSFLDAEPEPTLWTRVEPRFENTRCDGTGHQGDADPHHQQGEGTSSASETENPFGDMDEEALAHFIADLVHKNTALEEQIRALQEHIAALEAEAADVPTRLREAVISGREEVLHAFGHRREEFERMLQEFARRERAHAKQERQRQERQRHEEAARKRQEQSRRRSRPSKPWWEVLEVSPEASEAEVRRAYRSLAKRYHPDRCETGDAERMAEINAARDEAMRRFETAA